MLVFFDVDTQVDFVYEKHYNWLEKTFKDGASYIPGSEKIRPNLKKLTEKAREKKIPILGSVVKLFITEEYRQMESELKRWGGQKEDYCIAGTIGQSKIMETYLEDPTSGWKGQPLNDLGIYISNPLIRSLDKEEAIKDDQLCRWLNAEYFRRNRNGFRFSEITAENFRELVRENDPFASMLLDSYVKKSNTGIDEISLEAGIKSLSGPRNRWAVYFEKQTSDVFTNPNAEELLKRAGIDKVVVYGVAAEDSVKAAVVGMQERGIQCYVVKDAVAGWNAETTQKALEEMKSKGAELILLEDINKIIK